MKIILDMGSGLTCKNEPQQVLDMIAAVHKNDNRRHEIILKWQLFKEFGELRPLHHGVFAHAVDYALRIGYMTTASVFDIDSLLFLQDFHIPFVKFAALDEMLSLMPDAAAMGYWRNGIVASAVSNKHWKKIENYTPNIMCCVREYPAMPQVYESVFTDDQLRRGISDHTDHTNGFSLAAAYRPEIYETHFCLHEQTGPDTGPFALRPNQLQALLEAL